MYGQYGTTQCVGKLTEDKKMCRGCKIWKSTSNNNVQKRDIIGCTRAEQEPVLRDYARRR